MGRYLGLVFMFALACSPARAVLFDSTDDPNFNTTAPGGALTGSGWQYEGQWLSFLGTPIAPQYFITAAHVGGNVGDIFTYNGMQYTTTAMFSSPNSDLRIWQVSGVFSTFAPIYTGSDEVGKQLVVFGRGTQRGAAVSPGGQLQGWEWGTPDGRQRWGTNVVSGITAGDSTQGDFLTAAFDHNYSATEAHLSVGDSGGGVFIQDAMGHWDLAGVNYGVDGPYATDAAGNGQFNASLFNQDGYYLEDSNHNWVPASGPGSFYATRISSNAAWIESVVPEPNVSVLIVAGVGLLVFISRGSRRVS